MTETIRVQVNGAPREVPREPARSLLSVLRDELDLTGAKLGCGEGVCGACTVLLDGRPVTSCRTWLASAEGRRVDTVEGLARNGELHPVQRAFVETGAMQCGYCTPGMVMATVALLDDNPSPSAAQVGEALGGNVCRCCTYPRIVRAVERAAELGRGEGAGWGAGGVVEGAVAAGAGAVAAGAADTALDASGSSPRPTDATASLPRPGAPWDLTPPGQRDWFAVLPEGLVVTRDPDPSELVGWTTSAGAWLHVGADGLVTAFTGKSEVGQDNRTALSTLVSSELGSRLVDVRLVMGDTDLCPYDEGTYGSRSIVDAGSLLVDAAATARLRLVELAAERLGAMATELATVGGRVTCIGDGRSVAFGELVAGRRLVDRAGAAGRLAAGNTTSGAGAPTPSDADLARRAAATEIVTGSRRYPSDLTRPGMLHGRVLRPPAPGATLRRVDTSAAAEPGVAVLHEGDFVGVAAADPLTARRAQKAIVAEWDLPPAVAEADLWAHLRANQVDEDGWERPFHDEAGDVDRALREAAVSLEATYTTAYIAHVPLETHAALAEWGDDGRLTVWVGTQTPFEIRANLAEALGLPEAGIRVIVPPTGGGFGGKHGAPVALEAARLARAAGRPVTVRWSRAEDFGTGYFRPAALVDIRTGSDRDGRITGWETQILHAGFFGLEGPYDIPDHRYHFQPTRSPLPTGAYRAIAATANHFARESHIDEIASALEIDPIDLRLAHLPDARLADALRTVAERIGWGAPREAGVGVGIAGGLDKDARVATAAEVRVAENGALSVLRIVTVFDCGAIVHPDGVRNQVEGATIMGLGGALFEAIRFPDGTVTNGSMTDYRVPRFADVPTVEVILIDRPGEPSAGAGETPIVAIAPALANAIFAACGVRLRSMPLVPDGRVPGVGVGSTVTRA
jgi:nicotinate dehydrogenase subunit B